MPDAPDDPQQRIEQAENAYRNGDFARARRVSRRVLAENPPEDVQAAAKDILGRTGPDRAAIILIAACLVFFVIVFAAYAGR